MRDLEEAATPFVSKAISSDYDTDLFSRDEQFLLARWAAKTAYSYDTMFDQGMTIGQGHPMQLRDNPHELPPGVVVFSCLEPRTKPSWHELCASA